VLGIEQPPVYGRDEPAQPRLAVEQRPAAQVRAIEPEQAEGVEPRHPAPRQQRTEPGPPIRPEYDHRTIEDRGSPLPYRQRERRRQVVKLAGSGQV